MLQSLENSTNAEQFSLIERLKQLKKRNIRQKYQLISLKVKKWFIIFYILCYQQIHKLSRPTKMFKKRKLIK